MAIYDVDTDGGGSYSTMFAAEAALPATFTEAHTITTEGATDDTTAVTLIGYNPTATNTLTIESLDDHQGVWNDDLYKLSVANGTVLQITEHYVYLIGLQVELNSQNANYQAVIQSIYNGSGPCYAERCLFKGANNATYRSRGVNISKYGDIFYFYNCVFWNFDTTNSSSANNVFYGTNSPIYLYNCTVDGSRNTEHMVVTGSIYAVNTILVNPSTATSSVGGGWDVSSDYNASDLATVTGGTNDVGSASITFNDAANGDYHLVAGDTDVINAGTNDPGSGLYSDDIDQVTRTGTWDIGADEFVASGEQPHYRYRNSSSLGLNMGMWLQL